MKEYIINEETVNRLIGLIKPGLQFCDDEGVKQGDGLEEAMLILSHLPEIPLLPTTKTDSK